MRPTVLALVLLSGVAVAATPGSKLPPAPVWPAGTTVDTIQGVHIADPYRELEDPNDPKVEAWSDAQNARTRGYLDALPGRAAVAAKLGRLIRGSSPFYGAIEARGPRVFAIYSDPAKQQPLLVAMDAAANPKSAKVLLDPNVLDPGGHTAIDWYQASPDGSKIGVSLSKNGSEDGTLHVYDVATMKEIEPPIDRVQYPTGGGGIAWTRDSAGFWYTRYPGADAPESERHFNMSLLLHKLGSDVASDKLVLSAKDGIPRTGEIFVDNRAGGDSALASVQLGDGGQWQMWVVKPDGSAQQIVHYEDRVIAGAIASDGTVFGLSRKDAPMGKVLKLSAPYADGFAQAQTIIPERQDSAIVDGGEFGSPLTIVGDRLFVTRISGGPNEVGIYDLSGGHGTTLALPPVSAVGEIDALPSGDALFDAVTYTEPPYFARWHAGQVTRTALVMTSPISFADTTVTRVFATSKDGTKVPVTIMARKGVKLDGHNPTLLYGYGGYGVNLTPSFAGSRVRLWLDAGGVYAWANIRGGGEYGDRWHTEGNLTNKQNVFDDFDAAGEMLIAKGYTTHDKLALNGASNGGLLMGATLTEHPLLARAVVSQVGIYDMMRVELDPNGAFNVTEFGTVKDPAQFKALYGYSPYHHVVKGTDYPAILFMTGANDGRVNPLHSRKFAAALQAAQGADRPILLRTSKSSGHGRGTSIEDRIVETTDLLMFLFDQLDMDAAAAGK